MAEYAVVKGTRVRATRVDSCGMPIQGPRSRLVTKAFATAGLEPVMRDANDIESQNAEGGICVADRTPPERKWHTATIELCKVNTCLISMFTDWELVLDWEGKPIGFSDQKEVSALYGVALEIWSGVGRDDECDVPTSNDILSQGTVNQSAVYGYLLVPVIKEATLSGWKIAADVSTFTLTGITGNGTRWGRGPYNVMATDANNTAGRLLKPMKKGQHYRSFRTTIAPPEVTSDCCPLILPAAYYDVTLPTPAPAAAIAPAQPPCDAVLSDEIQSVTLTADGTLSFGGQQTTTLAAASTAAQVQAALEALSSIGEGNVTVTGTGPYTVTFAGTLAGTNVPQIAVAPAASGSVSTTQQGGQYTP